MKKAIANLEVALVVGLSGLGFGIAAHAQTTLAPASTSPASCQHKLQIMLKLAPSATLAAVENRIKVLPGVTAEKFDKVVDQLYTVDLVTCRKDQDVLDAIVTVEGVKSGELVVSYPLIAPTQKDPVAGKAPAHMYNGPM